MASQSTGNSIVSCMGESNQYNHGTPDGYTNNGTGKTSDLALSSSEGPNAHLQPGDIQSLIQPQTVEPPAVPLPTHEQGLVEPISVYSKQYNAILRRRQLRMSESPENIIAIQKRDILRARQRAANKRPRGEDGRFLRMNQQQSESSAGGAYNRSLQVGSSAGVAYNSALQVVFKAKKTDQRLVLLDSENGDESGATKNTGTQYWQAKSNNQNTASSTQCTALFTPSDLAVLPPPPAEPDLEFTFPPNLSDLLFNIDDVEFDMTGMYSEPMADAAGSSTAVAAEKMVLPTMLRDRLRALKEYMIQNPAETFVKDVSIVQGVLSGIGNTELPRDTYLAVSEIVSLMDMGAEYDAAKERQKKRENLIGLSERLRDSKAIVASSFWLFQEEQKRLAEHKVSKLILQQKVAALEAALNKTKSQLISVSSSIIKQMGLLKKVQEEGLKEKENAKALEAAFNQQTAMLGDAEADEELMGRPARVVEAAKQKINVLLGENP